MTEGHVQFPVLGAKGAIAFTGLFHTSVASLAIGFAFVVTVAQIVGYLKKDNRYDLLAKRVQLFHVCIYNIGTIVAIGLVFCLSGLFPQFWSQIFVHLFWTLMAEEYLFFLLATTLTFHYFFWDHMWGHKKLHILLGALMNPFFLLQFYLINGMGAFMMTPGHEEGTATIRNGILGWDIKVFYNPSFLMLTFHRALANVSYGGFVMAAICGIMLYLAKREKVRDFYEEGGRLTFYTAFAAFLSLPIVGYFYAAVIKMHANEAYVNLMWGRGDVVAGGIDWWWFKQFCVAAMLGMCFAHFHRSGYGKANFGLPRMLIYSIATFYVLYYIMMGAIMTWAFAWWMIAAGVGGALLASHLQGYHNESPRAVFLVVGILSFITVILGGYVREASRPRFVDRIAHYDSVYVPEERQPYLMVDVKPEDIPKVIPIPPPSEPVMLIRERCVGCHTVERVKNYRAAKVSDWRVIVRQMQAYGLRLSVEESVVITDHLQSGEPY